jgi:hypothetical protein
MVEVTRPIIQDICITMYDIIVHNIGEEYFMQIQNKTAFSANKQIRELANYLLSDETREKLTNECVALQASGFNMSTPEEMAASEAASVRLKELYGV